VLAAAIRARAQIIVTSNIPGLPRDQLAQWDRVQDAGGLFILDQIDLDREVVYGAVQRIDDVWASLERCGLVEGVAALRS
jgi:hypothetical protein